MLPLRDDQPTRSFPFITLLLIAANVLVFAGWQLRVGLEDSVAMAGFLPEELTTRSSTTWYYVFTSMFMHGGWMHLLGNMWFLWIFGKNVEDNCGFFRYLLFYLLCGVAATLAFTIVDPHSKIPLVGASGAISGILGAYLLHHPRARVLTLVPIGPIIRLMEIPAWMFFLIWIGFQVLSQVLASRAHGVATSGVAYAAHIGGFIAGMFLIVFFEKGRDSWRRHA
jgi:membrane associated rhomboid family serine protease